MEWVLSGRGSWIQLESMEVGAGELCLEGGVSSDSPKLASNKVFL